MDLENGLGAFDRVTLKGRNVGAAMPIRHGSTTGGSQVKMRDPGVCIFLEHFNRPRPKKWRKSKMKKSEQEQEKYSLFSKLAGFPSILVVFALLLVLFVAMS
ncbi:hypothetical protein M5689_019301 [Euphorbia peplus]|nr:hypothetical protein M5689_019301 [Euphorbia peplus]